MGKRLTTLFLGGALSLCTLSPVAAQTADGALPTLQQLKQMRRGGSVATNVPTHKSGPVFNNGGLVSKRAHLSRPARFSGAPRHADATYTDTWSCTVNSDEAFGQFTVIDANGDAAESWGDWYGIWVYNEDEEAAIYRLSDDWEDADDWLVSPGIQLKAGRPYLLKFRVKCGALWGSIIGTEMFEVKMGTAATVDGLATIVKEQTTLKDMEWNDYTCDVKVDEDGTYYFGLHCTSPQDNGYEFYLASMSVAPDPSALAPAAVEGLQLVPDATGGLNAELQFTAPTVCKDGSELAAITGIRIFADGELLADVRRATPGKPFTYADRNLPSAGLYTYTVVPYNEAGDGAPATVTGWVGLDAPTAPQNVVLTDGVDHIALTWDAAQAAHDGVFFPEQVDYTLSTLSYNSRTKTYTEKSEVATLRGQTDYQMALGVDEGRQDIVLFGVKARNDAGSTAITSASVSRPLLIGAPYATPFGEGFADGYVHYFWNTYAEGWGADFGSAGVTVSSAQDATDDGAAAMLQVFMDEARATRGSYLRDSVSLATGKITLAGTTAPKLVFKMKKGGRYGMLRVEVLNAAGEVTQLDAIDLSAVESTDWQVMKYDLTPFVNERWIQVSFGLTTPSGSASTVQRVYLDNVIVGDLPAKDLTVKVAADEEVERGGTANVYVKVVNNGDEDVEAYKLSVTVGGKELAGYTIAQQLKSFESRVFSFTYQSTMLEQADVLTVNATATLDGDADETDNAAVTAISVYSPDIVPVGNLQAEKDESDVDALSVALSWEAPAAIVSQTEGFEHFTSWSTAPQRGWSAIDGDGAPTYGIFNGVDFENEGTAFAFITFNPYNYGGRDAVSSGQNPSLVPYEGEQYMAALYSMDDNNNLVDADNWLITPELSGKAQTVTFYVNNINSNGRDFTETFDVLYSEGGTAAADFVKLGETHTATGGQWTEVSVALPEGARYMAIHHNTAANAATYAPFMLMVDAVSFEVNNAEVEKYLVYRDGQLIGETTQTAFTDTEVADDTAYTYQVTVVYAGGVESPAVQQRVSIATGIRSAAAAAAVRPFDVYTLDGTLVRRQVLSTDGLKGVYVINGQKVILK